ncbi:glycosyltransferase [soil metagenome]
MIEVLILVSALFALVPAAIYFANAFEFRVPSATTDHFAISVLIPARNEEMSIAACVESLLSSLQVELEVIVLDDASTDRTAEIARGIVTRDSRVRLEKAPPLPEGWSGKQHACFSLSKLATKPLLCYLDADVRLTPDALCRMATFQQQSGAALVSGFPRQETGTILERLLIPLIHFVLLSYLPLRVMRGTSNSRFGAGCGQLFVTTREAYERVGGHEAVKASFHDGVKLPRAYREHGLRTDICDATPLATCRMYRSGHEVWNGLAKNAREGLGGPVGLWVWTAILLIGQVMPFLLYCEVVDKFFWTDFNRFYFGIDVWKSWQFCIAAVLPPFVCTSILAVRLHAAWRFRQSFLSAFLHPLGILLLLGVQWYAAIRTWIGQPIGWKGRTQPDTAPYTIVTVTTPARREEFQS